MKYKYNIIAPLLDEKTGVIYPAEEQAWTGVFENKQKADEWYENYGKAWEARGKKLVRRGVLVQTQPN